MGATFGPGAVASASPSPRFVRTRSASVVANIIVTITIAKQNSKRKAFIVCGSLAGWRGAKLAREQTHTHARTHTWCVGGRPTNDDNTNNSLLQIIAHGMLSSDRSDRGIERLLCVTDPHYFCRCCCWFIHMPITGHLVSFVVMFVAWLWWQPNANSNQQPTCQQRTRHAHPIYRLVYYSQMCYFCSLV